MIGTLLANRYRIETQLGEGGMGVVYHAHDTLLDRSVALKALSPHLFSPEGLKRLLREAQAAARLTHPGIVATYDVIEDGDARFIVMEFVAGRTLRDMIPLPWQDVVGIASQVCQALDYAHAQGVVHRDIKPENIIITGNGFAKLMDFGLARSEGRSRLTQTGMIVGTVAYMAPEQAIGGLVDPRSDLYSLGAVLYEAITGKPPFAADDPIAVISMHVNVPPVSPRFHTPGIPAVLESTILRLLSKDPTARYASASELDHVLKTSLLSAETPEAAAVEARPAGASLFDMMTRGRLIDREEELAALKATLESMLSGRGQVVLVAGEPGIGKTRLAEELLVYARLRGCLAVSGHCYEQEVNIPYLPFSEALLTAIRAVPTERMGPLVGPHAPELVKLVPELRHQIPGLAPSPPLEPEQERIRLFEAVTAFLSAHSRRQPVVLMLDDLHWADAATLALLRHLARRTRAERMLMVGTYRDVEVDPDHPLSGALSEMNRERLHQRVLIRGLTPQHVAAMIQAIFQSPQPVSDEFRDLIYRDTEGNPFFVEEVLKHLVEVGALYIEDGRWQRKPVQEIDVPQSMREVIGRRLRRVSDHCQRVLSLAAVIGRRFSFEVLQAVGELAEDQLLDALEEGMRAQLIREQSDAGEVEYDFVHATIREVLYERLSLRRRMTLHQRVGETLERLHAGRLERVVEDLAHHFTRAPHGVGLEKAIEYSLQAARKSMSLFAHEDASRHYQNAIDLLEEAGDKRRRAETHLALGEPLVYLGNTTAAVEQYKRALEYFGTQGTPGEVAHIHRLTGSALQRNWEFSEAIPHLERALQGLSQEDQWKDVVRTHLDLARAQTFSGRTARGEEHARAALVLAEAHNVVPLLAEAHVALGLCAHRNETAYDIDTARAHYAEAVRVAAESTDPDAFYTLGRALNNLAILAYEDGDFQAGLQLSARALETAQRARDFEQISFHHLQLNFAHMMLGDWKAARRYLDDALQMPMSPVRRLTVEHRLHWLEGNWEAAADVAQRRLDHDRRTGQVQGTYVFAGLAAWHYLDLDRLPDALQAALAVTDILEHSAEYFAWLQFTFIAEALALGGEHGRCEALCLRAERVTGVRNKQAQASARYGQGVLALARGDVDRAITLLQEALDPAPLPVHVYRLRALARALRLRSTADDLLRAREALGTGAAKAEEMGDTRRAAQLRADLAALSR